MSMMASSSVSQEDLDREENDISIRKPRYRMTRTRQSVPRVMDNVDQDHSSSTNHDGTTGRQSPNGPNTSQGAVAGGIGTGADGESPKLASRAKDKRVRPNLVNKGKAQRDRRKLREKRRSTGVVHLPSTESTGEDDDEVLASTETKKNTVCNEVIDKPSEERMRTCPTHRNKSPSDLDADDEDNQDYDSAVNQSEPHSQSIQASIISAAALRLKSPGFTEGKSSPSYEAKTTVSIEEDSLKLLEKERQENKRLLLQLEQKDRRIKELVNKVEILDKELCMVISENSAIKEENYNLQGAIERLSTKSS